MSNSVGIVIIGRNEARRIGACVEALGARAVDAVYVDSGSGDGSPEIAERLGGGLLRIVRLTEGPFSAARGRRIGLETLLSARPDLAFVQFIDGDCRLDPQWIDRASDYLLANPRAAAVVGRLREEDPDRSILVRLTDIEWELPVGEIDVIGGIAMVRVDALAEAGGWRDGLVAGEELDLSMRLRERGWMLRRLTEPMCTHDVGITRFGEFWKRSLRAGYGYCNLSLTHRRSGPRRWLRRTAGSLAYGLMLPVLIITSAVLWWPAAVVLTLLGLSLPARLAMQRRKRGDPWRISLAYGAVMTICKAAMALGVLRCLRERLTGARADLIEYKAPTAPAPAASASSTPDRASPSKRPVGEPAAQT